MSDIQILKAVEYDELGAQTKKRYSDLNEFLKAGWWVQPKFDGCFGLARISQDNASGMFSRTGKNYSASCGHILDQLAALADQQSGAWDDFVVLGEVFHAKHEFPTISGMFRKRAKSDLSFLVHDLLAPDLTTSDRYSARYADLAFLVDGRPLYRAENVSMVPVIKIAVGQDVMGLAKDYVSRGGYDGLVMKDPNAGYSIGLARNGEIVKVKPVLSLDLVITRINIGTGDKTGRDVFTIDVHYRGKDTTVGSGMPHELGDIAVGQIAEIECMGLTTGGALREPRFKGIRHDKERPDE